MTTSSAPARDTSEADVVRLVLDRSATRRARVLAATADAPLSVGLSALVRFALDQAAADPGAVEGYIRAETERRADSYRSRGRRAAAARWGTEA